MEMNVEIIEYKWPFFRAAVSIFCFTAFSGKKNKDYWANLVKFNVP